MSEPVASRPTICLNMIVRDEAHIVCETLDSVAPYISSWVIVDTGSTDGTQDLILAHLAGLDIPGELYERPWRDFGHNRTEALALAQRHGDYIWVMDADDLIYGTPDFTQLGAADYYLMRIAEEAATLHWRPQLFRDGLDWRYEGVVHEYAAWDGPCAGAYLDGDYCIVSRHLGSRSRDPQKYARDRDLLLAEVERNPEDARSVFYLAQSYLDLRDLANARRWYERRIEMGGWDQEVYAAMLRLAAVLETLGEPWRDVEAAYLRAWEFRPSRAESLYYVALRYRRIGEYRIGYRYAKRAAETALPGTDLLVMAEIYTWKAIDEQASCGYRIGKQIEAFTLWRQLLGRTGIPDEDRKQIAAKRDTCVPAMLNAAAPYPKALIRSLVAGAADAAVTASLVAGPGDHNLTERTLNSFLNCCTDVARVGRFVVVDTGLSDSDRAVLGKRYGFVEFVGCDAGDEPGAQLAAIRDQIGGRYWLHLGRGWRFFAPDDFIGRLTAVLEAEPGVFQVGINIADATQLIHATAGEQAVRQAPGAGRYVLADTVAAGPAMFDTARLDRAGNAGSAQPDSLTEFGRRATVAGLHSASLDEVLCIQTG